MRCIDTGKLAMRLNVSSEDNSFDSLLRYFHMRAKSDCTEAYAISLGHLLLKLVKDYEKEHK